MNGFVVINCGRKNYEEESFSNYFRLALLAACIVIIKESGEFPDSKVAWIVKLVVLRLAEQDENYMLDFEK